MAIFKSKKFWMAVVGIVAMIVSSFIPAITEEMIMGIAGIIISYILGQGIADNGKEAAKIEEGE